MMLSEEVENLYKKKVNLLMPVSCRGHFKLARFFYIVCFVCCAALFKVMKRMIDINTNEVAMNDEGNEWMMIKYESDMKRDFCLHLSFFNLNS